MQAALRADRAIPRIHSDEDHSAVEVIRAALAHLDAGRAVEAMAKLDRLKPIEVTSQPACTLAGLICVSLSAHRKALAWLDRAAVLGPVDPTVTGHRANALAAIGDHAQALAAFDIACEGGSIDPVLHFNRANLLRATGRLGEAIASYDVALRLRPAFPEALRAGGTVLRDLGHPDGALRFLGEALRLKPDDVDVWIERTALLHGLHRYDEALLDYERALTHLPHNALLLTNRGIALIELGRLDEACGSLEAAIARDPTLPQAHMNLGNALVWLGRPDEALIRFEAALSLDEHYPEAACGRGLALKLLGRYDEALASFEAALADDPDFPHARANRGEIHLIQGDLARGWPDYEFRFLAGRQDRPTLKGAVPFWTGEPCRGARLAVLADQGNGDKIQFARYLPLLAATGAVVTFVCPARLQRLLRDVTAGLRVVDAVGEDETFDLQVSLSSLPACFRTTLDTIPGAGGYLTPDPALVARWADRLGRQGLKIGLCWRGHQGWQVDPRRSVPLGALAPLAALPDVRLVSLQLPDAGEGLADALSLEEIGGDLDAGPDGFVDTAAVMANLDLIVTCDTSIAHLAGALGRPVWVLLQSSPEWRWLLETDQSPWYGSMRLFRQRERGAWAEPVDVLVRAVAQWAEAWRSHRDAQVTARTLRVPVPIGDVVDKMTILRIKREHMRDAGKRENVRRELDLLEEVVRSALSGTDPRLDDLANELGHVNQALWTIEDEIRDCERRRDFGPGFVALARSVYITNDRRAALKREINLASGSPLLEEKEYRAG